MTSGIIDAYAHCGLRKYRPIEDVRAVASRFGVSRTVLVQHLGEYDNAYIERVVAADRRRLAGCFVIDTEADGAPDTLARWAGKGVFRGIRLLAHTLEQRPELWEQAVQFDLNVIVYGEPTLGPYVDSLASFLTEHPKARLILSHLGALTRGESPRFPSFDRVLSLAAFPNAYMQISAMHMFADYPYIELVPLVERALDAFDASRLLYGSNYPLMKDDVMYGQELALVCDGQLGVPCSAVEQVVSLTARTLWFDQPPDA